MEIDDDDAFLYGDQPIAPEQPSDSAQLPTASSPQRVPEESSQDVLSASVSASMAASLAAYGIDPSHAVVEDMPEDGGVEEEPEDDSDKDSDSDDDDDDDDDIKLVFTDKAQRLDLRKPQQQQSNVIGIGKWAHTATSTAPPVASPTQQKASTPSKPTPTPTPDVLTDYQPAARPGLVTNPPIPPSGDSGTPITLQPTPNVSSGANIPTEPTTIPNGAPGIVSLPHSTLPPVRVASLTAPIDPTLPTAIIPSSGQSVYELDLAQFEGSGQPWRKPGSEISDYFNYGFDEVSWPKFLRFRNEMEQGRAALMNMQPMGGMPQELVNMLNMPMAGFNNPQAQAQAQMQQQMQQMMAMGGMPGMPGIPGMDPGMMGFGMHGQGPGQGPGQMGGPMGGGQQMGMMMGSQNQNRMQPQQQQQQNIQQQQMQQQHQQQHQQLGGQPAGLQGNGSTGATQETGSQAGDDVKPDVEGDGANGAEGGMSVNPQMTIQQGFPLGRQGVLPMRGTGINRGMPIFRGRGGAPLGPRGVGMVGAPGMNMGMGSVMPPKGPKARFRDKDRVTDANAGGASLDYGGSGDGRDSVDEGESFGGNDRRSRSPDSVRSDIRERERGDRSERRERDRGKDKIQDSAPGDYREKERKEKGGRDRERSRKRSGYDEDFSEGEYDSRGSKEKEREKEREHKSGSGREKEKERRESREKRRRDDGAPSVGTLGPAGWESEEEEPTERRSSRRKRSTSVEEEQRSRTTRSKRR